MQKDALITSVTKETTVLYDPQMFDIQNYGGISRYFANLIAGVQTSDNYKALLPILYSDNYYIRDFPQLLNNKIGQILMKKARKRSKWNRIYASQQIKTSKFDLLHATYYNPYFLESSQKPLVITMHDMIYENYPHLFPEAEQVIRQKKIMIESASLIIAISEFTKKQIHHLYPNLSTPVRVIYHGLPELQSPEANEILPKNFLLYVGDRFALYKNFKPFIEAIAPILNIKKDLVLICAGGGPIKPAEQELFKKCKISMQVIQMNVSDALMKQLYKNAMLFVYPSLEEGFGLPLLEAFNNGCAIACSNSSCLPEVGGNAVSYFNPLSIGSISTTIEELIKNPELRKILIKNGYVQVKKFTFTNCLNQTLACYKSLL